MKFAVKYHQLATPLVAMEFKENDGCGIWLLKPSVICPHRCPFVQIIVEMQFGIITVVTKIGTLWAPLLLLREFQVTYPPSSDASNMRPSSGRQSGSGNQRIGCCSIRAGSTVPQGLAMKSLTRPW